ncbi:MAG: hypothetical protein K0S48_4025 [Ramlibacter sp.]|nr:hypothetical protein [Ramlibacter sp.]
MACDAGSLIVSVVISATPMVAVRPGSAPMITPTRVEASTRAIDVGVRKLASDWPKEKRPWNIEGA